MSDEDTRAVARTSGRESPSCCVPHQIPVAISPCGTKTLIPLKSVAVLDKWMPNFHRMERVCERVGATGLYPYAVSDRDGQVSDARQFPKSSGYPEDAATGIAAALAFGLLANKRVEISDRPIRVRQGCAMGGPRRLACGPVSTIAARLAACGRARRA